MIPRFLSAFLCQAVFFCAFAQPPSPTEKTLLWRISGKQLKGPSYLYGTMHLTDERLFNFSDSLLKAIETSEGFAIEIDPDQMITLMMDEELNAQQKTRLLKDVISKKAYTKYAPLLAKRLKKAAEKITVKDVVAEQNKWMQEAYVKGAMPTFVDIWLFDVARNQGKWTGGVEDMQDQAGLLEDIFTEQDLEFLTVDYNAMGKKFLDQMITTYASENIVALDSIISGGSQRQKDLLLTRRNVKMAYRMDSLAAVRSMVFAVGAAHLAGDSGVINLLRKKGFDVQPVFSATKTAGSKYEYKIKPVAWQKATGTQGLYEVEMPGKPIAYKVYGMVEMLMNINLFNSSSYLAMAVPAGNNSDPDALMLQTARNMMQDNKLKQGKLITRNGNTGREYSGKGPDGFKRAQIFIADNTMFVSCVMAVKETIMFGDDAQRFLNSMKVLRKNDDSSQSWVSFEGLIPGITGKAPVAFELNHSMDSQMAQEGYDTKTYTAIETKNNGIYMLISRITMNDSYFPDDSIYLAGIRENSRERLGIPDIDTMTITDGYYNLEQKGVYKTEQLKFHGKTYVMGNRAISFFAMSPKEMGSGADAEMAIQSFKTIPLPQSTWSRNQAEHFSTSTPAPFTFVKKDSAASGNEEMVNYNTRDTMNSYVFSVVRTAFGPENWYNNPDTFWHARVAAYAEDGDTILYKKPFTANGLTGYDFAITKIENPKKISRIRLFLYGDTLYTLFSGMAAKDADNAGYQRFFTDFRFEKPVQPTTIFTNKAADFMARLTGKDSAKRAEAYMAFYDAGFIKTDIPLLRKALVQHYDWDTTENFHTPLPERLGDRLGILGDTSLPDFIKKEYAHVNGRDAEEQTTLLKFLLLQPTQEHVVFVVDALTNTSDTAKINTAAFDYLADSVTLLKSVLPTLLPLLEKTNMTEDMIHLTAKMLDSNVVEKSNLTAHEKTILNFGITTLQDINATETGYGYRLADVCKIAGYLKTPSAIGFLKQVISSKHNPVKMEAVYGFLQAGETIPAVALQTIAADKSLRVELWDGLAAKNKQILFPLAYKKQQTFAEAALHNYITDEDDEPGKMNFVTLQKVTIAGKACNLYVFKTLTYGENFHLGAVAFPAKTDILKPLNNGAFFLWDDVYELKNQSVQIKKLLQEIIDNSSED